MTKDEKIEVIAETPEIQTALKMICSLMKEAEIEKYVKMDFEGNDGFTYSLVVYKEKTDL